MPRFIARWTLSPGTSLDALTGTPLRQPALEYAHYWNLSAGVVVAVFDAPDEATVRSALAARPPEALHRVEFEYDRITSEMRRI
ncbi:MAG TPA: hypothetical protein VF406_07595 [Thermodesulfobacteriota bacterium]